MTTILSWNIQYGKGCDGLTDPARIRREIGRIGLPDVICLQEVSDGFADLDAGADQVAVFAGLFDGYHPVFAPGIDRSGSDGRRQRFGNMVLSRLPVLETEMHLLPRPADPSVRHMRRVAVAVMVASAAGPLRVATTHLEFFAASQRRAQVQQIRSLSAEWLDNAARPPQPGRNTYAAPPPVAGLVWCGDFNLVPADPEYAALLAPLPGEAGRLQDAWTLLRGTAPHLPTCGIHDAAQWPEGAHARDFFFVCPALQDRVVALDTDTDTAASDHQPLWLTLADGAAA